jgi:hypothetical protein
VATQKPRSFSAPLPRVVSNNPKVVSPHVTPVTTPSATGPIADRLITAEVRRAVRMMEPEAPALDFGELAGRAVAAVKPEDLDRLAGRAVAAAGKDVAGVWLQYY